MSNPRPGLTPGLGDEMGGSAREIVLDFLSEFGCRNDGGGIYKLGWDGKTNIEDNYGRQWVCRTQK